MSGPKKTRRERGAGSHPGRNTRAPNFQPKEKIVPQTKNGGRRLTKGEHARLKTWGGLRRIEAYVDDLLRLDKDALLEETDRRSRREMTRQINRLVGKLFELRGEITQ